MDLAAAAAGDQREKERGESAFDLLAHDDPFLSSVKLGVAGSDVELGVLASDMELGVVNEHVDPPKVPATTADTLWLTTA